MLKSLEELKSFIPHIKKQRLVIAAAHDENIVEAIDEANKLGIIEPILIGKQIEIIELLKKYNIDYSNYAIIDSESDELSAFKAVEMIRENKADILMKGLLDTKVLLKEVVNRETGIRRRKVLSHVTLLSYPNLDRILFATDCAMIISPSLEEKIEIIENVLELSKKLDYTKPLIGIVSAVEKVNPKILSTVDAASLKETFINREDCILDGPFAIDNLVSMESVHHKGIKSEVAGKADILVFPNIESGNVFYKTSTFLANATAAGIILGASCPIVLTSRADSSVSKLNSIILSVVYYAK